MRGMHLIALTKGVGPFVRLKAEFLRDAYVFVQSLTSMYFFTIFSWENLQQNKRIKFGCTAVKVK